MPSFMYTVIAFSSLFWFIAYSYARSNDPNENFLTIAVFLGLLLVSLTLTFSIPAYFYVQAKAPNFSNLRVLFRRGIKWAFYLSFGIVFYLALMAFKLDNAINTVLFLILYMLVFIQLGGRR